MPHVMFWRFPDEERDFLESLESIGQTMAVPFTQVRSREELAPLTLSELLARAAADSVLIGPAESVADVRIHEFHDNDGAYYVASHRDSPLLMYRRGRLMQDGSLSASALAGHWSYADPEGNRTIPKRESFVSWGKAVFRRIRKATPHTRGAPDERMTPRVAAAVADGLKLTS
jgi:hypothetical protein